MLANVVEGATRPSQTITWTRSDGSAEDLTGATLTGTIADAQGTVRAIAGTLTLVSASAGQFRWDFAADDVATVGLHSVQFTATFGTAPTTARTYAVGWYVYPTQQVV